MFRVFDLELERSEWDARIAELPLGLQDVYFSSGYHLLWQRHGDGWARGAMLDTDEGAVLYPFLLRPLEPVLGPQWADRCDLSSAYGYGGPLVHPTQREAPDTVSRTAAGPLTESPDALDALGAAADDQVRLRLLAGLRTRFATWCAEHGVVSEFIRFHPLLRTERGMPGGAPAAGECHGVEESAGEGHGMGSPAVEREPGAEMPPPGSGDDRRGVAVGIEVVPANETVWGRLSTPEEHRSALSSSTRRNLRKAERAGLTCAEEDDDGAWAAFIDLYTDTMKRRSASEYYLFPRRYFDDCRKLLGDRAALLCVRRPAQGDGDQRSGAGTIVAAALFLRSPRAVHYHLGGSDAAALAERPNNLLFVAAMDWGAALGAARLHLGGGFRGGGDDELFRFKAGFSPLRSRLYVGRCVHDHEAYERALQMWRERGGVDPGGYFPAYRAPLGGCWTAPVDRP